MKRISMLAAACGLALLAAPALAHEGHGGGEGGHRGAHGRGPMIEADANGDGQITRAEADAARAAMFTRMDANGDGALTQADRDQRRAERQERRQERRGARVAQQDSNNDGRSSREEFLAGPNPWFERADANNNGVLEASELQAMRGRHHGHAHPDGERGPPPPPNAQ
ncbi:MAG: hypothetical protein AB7L65_08020 [Hyphomonadaceae bacterium]